MVDVAKTHAMKNIIDAMNSVGSGSNPLRTENSDGNIKAMRDILSRFRTATNNVIDQSNTNSVLKEAIQTQKTNTGVRIAEWEITVKSPTHTIGKFYDIINTKTETSIATNLRLYEAALLLTKELNRGNSITSKKIREILILEENYSKYMEDAIRYTRIMNTSDGEKKMIAEARYSDVKSKLILTKKQLKSLR